MKSIKQNYVEDKLENKASIVKPGEGETLQVNNNAITFKVTSDMANDQLGVYEILLAPGEVGAKLHYHRFMDETFLVQKGTLTIQVGTKTHVGPVGTVVYIPRFTPHGFRNDTKQTVKVTLLFNPSQKREGFFRGLHQIVNEEPIDSKKFLKLYYKYDSFPIDANNIVPEKSKGKKLENKKYK